MTGTVTRSLTLFLSLPLLRILLPQYTKLLVEVITRLALSSVDDSSVDQRPGRRADESLLDEFGQCSNLVTEMAVPRVEYADVQWRHGVFE